MNLLCLFCFLLGTVLASYRHYEMNRVMSTGVHLYAFSSGPVFLNIEVNRYARLSAQPAAETKTDDVNEIDIEARTISRQALYTRHGSSLAVELESAHTDNFIRLRCRLALTEVAQFFKQLMCTGILAKNAVFILILIAYILIMFEISMISITGTHVDLFLFFELLLLPLSCIAAAMLIYRSFDTMDILCACQRVINNARQIAIHTAESDFDALITSMELCAICQEECVPNGTACCLLLCSHVYHTECMLEWASRPQGDCCPVCRAKYV